MGSYEDRVNRQIEEAERAKPLRRWTVVKRGRGLFRRYWIKVTPAGSYGPGEEPPAVGITLAPVEHPRRKP